eukprot:GHVN01024111.1.p1 GENE.GHVN01024111.1~~GHVN01024111.1.p1  ORF type:complete len:220 (-),score=30.33 GHVN01024111.1:114-773(-)
MAQKNFDANFSGCTALIALKIQDDILISYVGDSKLVAYRYEEMTKKVTIFQTLEHCPSRQSERHRICLTGASVHRMDTLGVIRPTFRILPHGIAMSRAFGDFAAHNFGVICQPEHAHVHLMPLPTAAREKDDTPSKLSYRWLLVLASDGLWDSYDENAVLSMLKPIWVKKHVFKSAHLKSSVGGLVDTIAKTAQDTRYACEQYSDDTTIIAAFFDLKAS